MRDSVIFIVTRQDAREVDGVIDILRDRGARVVRWNTCQFPENSHVSLSGAPSSRISALGDYSPDAGWIHPQPSSSVHASLDGLPREIALAEFNGLLNGILFSTPCRWLNSPQALLVGSNKILQLQLASDFGIKVPPYLITNNYDEILRFEAVHGKCVLKALSRSYWQYGSIELKTYTRRLRDYSEGLEESLRYGAILVQKEIAKSTELRVTVVGERAFTVSFDRFACESDVVDIRQLDFSKYRDCFRYSTSWSKIEELSSRLIHKLGFSYAGLDWVIDEDSTPYFLECNPLGAFKWYEICGAAGLTEAIATELLRLASGE